MRSIFYSLLSVSRADFTQGKRPKAGETYAIRASHRERHEGWVQEQSRQKRERWKIMILGLQVAFLFTHFLAQTLPRQPTNQSSHGGFKSIVLVIFFTHEHLSNHFNNWRFDHSLTPKSTYIDVHDIRNNYYITMLQSLSTAWRMLRPVLCIIIYKYSIIIGHNFNKLCLCFRRKL